MTVSRVVAIALIYLATALGWFALGTSVVVRSGEHDARLAREVSLLWGGPHTQVAPTAWIERERETTERVEEKDESGRTTGTRRVTRTAIDRIDAPLLATRARVALALDHRRKGLLWYDTYGVTFRATYRFSNPDSAARPLVVHFAFPCATTLYDDFVFKLNDAPVPASADLTKGVTARTDLAARGEARVEVSYRSRGLGEWNYVFGKDGVAQVRDFELVMDTDFGKVDFPAGTMSPTSKTETGPGWALTWRFANLVTGQRVGLDLPNRINPGPLASRITFFAPVSLLFFVTVMLLLGVTRGTSLHPMHYFFLSAAFFAFHLLLAYLVDHVSIHVAFAIAAATSVGLVVSYLRVVTGMKQALAHAGAAQFVFLVLFSYAFFFEGYTGLTVTVGAVVTLFLLMQMTARVAWDQVLGGGGTRDTARGRL